MGEIVDLNEYRKKKEAEPEAEEEKKLLQCFIDHAKTLKWDDK